MRSLHVPHAYEPAIGGAETLCRRIGIELAAIGHDVSVLTADWVSAEGWFTPGVPGLGATCFADTGVTVQRVSLDSWTDHVRANRPKRLQQRFTRLLERHVKLNNPDVILTLPHLLPNVRASIQVAIRSSVPLVMVPLLHEDDPFWPFEDLRRGLQSCSAALAMTRGEADRLVNGYGMSRDRVFVSGLGVDQVADSRSSSGPPRVVSIGRMAPSKNIPVLVEAMKIVWREFPSVRLTLAGASVPGGPGRDELTKGLTEHERTLLDIEADIDTTRKTELLNEAHCFAIASTRESFGLVSLEAMGHGVPLVCADTPVNREVTGGNALFVEAEPGPMAAGILEILRDPGTAKALASRAKQHTEANHSWSHVRDVAEAAFRKAITDPLR